MGLVSVSVWLSGEKLPSELTTCKKCIWDVSAVDNEVIVTGVRIPIAEWKYRRRWWHRFYSRPVTVVAMIGWGDDGPIVRCGEAITLQPGETIGAGGVSDEGVCFASEAIAEVVRRNEEARA